MKLIFTITTKDNNYLNEDMKKDEYFAISKLSHCNIVISTCVMHLEHIAEQIVFFSFFSISIES